MQGVLPEVFEASVVITGKILGIREHLCRVMETCIYIHVYGMVTLSSREREGQSFPVAPKGIQDLRFPRLAPVYALPRVCLWPRGVLLAAGFPASIQRGNFGGACDLRGLGSRSTPSTIFPASRDESTRKGTRSIDAVDPAVRLASHRRSLSSLPPCFLSKKKKKKKKRVALPGYERFIYSDDTPPASFTIDSHDTLSLAPALLPLSSAQHLTFIRARRMHRLRTKSCSRRTRRVSRSSHGGRSLRPTDSVISHQSSC